METGWVKLYRKLFDSDMYKQLNSKQFTVMIVCLLMANHKPSKWEYKGEIYEVQPGQFVTSLEHIAKNCPCDMSVQSVRTALLKLERWGFLTNKSTKTGRLITIVNWAFYQGDDDDINKDSNSALTKNQQRTNKDLTTNKNDKNEKNEKNIYNTTVTERKKDIYNNTEGKKPEANILSNQVITPLVSDKPNPNSDSETAAIYQEAAEEPPYDDIMKMYNSICPPALPKIATITNERRRMITARWHEHPDIETFKTVFTNAAQSDYICGRTKRKFKGSFDWLMQEQFFVKTLEGFYNRTFEQQPQQQYNKYSNEPTPPYWRYFGDVNEG